MKLPSKCESSPGNSNQLVMTSQRELLDRILGQRKDRHIRMQVGGVEAQAACLCYPWQCILINVVALALFWPQMSCPSHPLTINEVVIQIRGYQVVVHINSRRHCTANISLLKNPKTKYKCDLKKWLDYHYTLQLVFLLWWWQCEFHCSFWPGYWILICFSLYRSCWKKITFSWFWLYI